MYDLQENLLNQQTTMIVRRLWSEFYQRIEGVQNKDIEMQALKTLHYILDMSVNVFEHTSEDYSRYLSEKVCVGLGYKLEDADKTPVYFYATCLRGLCEGNKELLVSDLIKLNVGNIPLPEGKEIRGFLSPKFKKLSHSFLANAENRSYQNFNEFVINEVQNVFYPKDNEKSAASK